MNETIGRCSLCGGDVTVFRGAWGGIQPPQPTCSNCGAHPKNTLPVIPMEAPLKPAWEGADPGYGEKLIR